MPQVDDEATLQRAAFLTDRAVRKHSTETMEAIKVPAMARHLTRVCSRTADTIAAYPDHPVQSARHTAGVITAWSAAAETGIIHELHTIMENLSDIRVPPSQRRE